MILTKKRENEEKAINERMRVIRKREREGEYIQSFRFTQSKPILIYTASEFGFVNFSELSGLVKEI